MPILVTADIHLTDLPRDEHRWGLFQFLAEQADKYKASAIIICGDLTDQKDRHPAKLVNDMVLGFEVLAMNGRQCIVLRGNHDYIEEDEPFFGFVSSLEDVKFVAAYEENHNGIIPGKVIGLLPNTRDPAKIAKPNFSQCDYIFCHQTFQGSVAENGFILPGGIDPAVFGKTKARIYSGDIHVPQIVSRKPCIEYIGAPYRVRFGDSFQPRVLLIQDDGTTKDLHFPTKGKHLLEINERDAIPHNAQRAMATARVIKAGDQVKVRVKMKRAAYPEWPAVRAAILSMAGELQWELTGPELIAAQEKPAKGQLAPKSGSPSGFSPDQALGAYAEKKRLSGPLLAAGEKWLKEAVG